MMNVGSIAALVMSLATFVAGLVIAVDAIVRRSATSETDVRDSGKQG